MLFDVIDRLADGLDLFGLFVGDRELELVLELHDEFYGVQRVGVQVVDEVGLAGDLALVHAHLLADDLDNLLVDVFHGLLYLPALSALTLRSPCHTVRGAETIAVTGPFAITEVARGPSSVARR